MFTLWYTVLTYKEYKDTIWEKLALSKEGGYASKARSVVKKSEPSKIPVIEPKNQLPKSPSPQPPKAQIVKPVVPQSRISKPLDPPAKPPRSPSPHPLKNEDFDDIDYEEEDSEVEEENSVIYKKSTNIVNDFIEQEQKVNNDSRYGSLTRTNVNNSSKTNICSSYTDQY